MRNEIGVSLSSPPLAAILQEGNPRRLALTPDPAGGSLRFPEGFDAESVAAVVCAVRRESAGAAAVSDWKRLFPQAKILRRPFAEAAAAWYRERVKEQTGEPYRGWLLVCSADDGGAAAAFCRIDEEGAVSSPAGEAREDWPSLGAALLRAAGTETAAPDEALAWATGNLAAFNRNMRLYDKSGKRIDGAAFTCGTERCACSRAAEAMQGAAQGIQRLLEAVDAVIAARPEIPERFPVLFADSVISLSPLQDAVRRHFSGLAYGLDSRYAIGLPEEERDMTAAYGAALLAAEEAVPQPELEGDCHLLTIGEPVLLGKKGTACHRLPGEGDFAAKGIYAVAGKSFTVRFGAERYAGQVPEFPSCPAGSGAPFSFGLRWQEGGLRIAVKPTFTEQTEKTVTLTALQKEEETV